MLSASNTTVIAPGQVGFNSTAEAQLSRAAPASPVAIRAWPRLTSAAV